MAFAVSTGALLAVARHGLILGLAAIFGISPILARAEPPACPALAAALPAFTPAAAGETAPDVPFLEGDDTARRLADYGGKPLVLNFWATWCAPCVREMPDLDRLRADFAVEGIEVLAISEDRQGMAKVDAFYAETGIVNLPRLLDPKGALSRALKLRGMPTTYFFDAAGRTIGSVEGPAPWHEPALRTALKACLRAGVGPGGA